MPVQNYLFEQKQIRQNQCTKWCPHALAWQSCIVDRRLEQALSVWTLGYDLQLEFGLA
jgi:hypothetical protein